MAISRVEQSYSIPGFEPKPRTYAALERDLTGLKSQMSDAAEHTFEASYVLLKQSNSLDVIPEHDMVRDGNVAAIRKLAQRLCHIKGVSEAFEIAIEIERHCSGYYEADAPADAAVATVAVCNAEARTEVRQVTALFDPPIQRRARRTAGRATGKGAR